MLGLMIFRSACPVIRARGSVPISFLAVSSFIATVTYCLLRWMSSAVRRCPTMVSPFQLLRAHKYCNTCVAHALRSGLIFLTDRDAKGKAFHGFLVLLAFNFVLAYSSLKSSAVEAGR